MFVKRSVDWEVRGVNDKTWKKCKKFGWVKGSRHVYWSGE